MPALTNIGGFYASLGLQPDKNSFENGMKLIGNTSDSLSKLIGVARNAAVVLAMDKLGASESALVRTSEKLGVSTEAVKLWSTAAKIAGVSADGVVSSMSKLGRTLEKQLFDASGVKTLQDAIWKLGISFEEIKDMTGDSAFKYILEKAQALAKVEGNTTVAWKLEEALGTEAEDLFLELQRTGKTVDEFLVGSSSRIYTNEEDDKAAAKFYSQWNTFKTTVENIATAVGTEGLKRLIDPMTKINEWVGKNGDNIEKAIDNIWGVVDKGIDGVIKPAISGIKEWWDANGDKVRDTLEEIEAGVAFIFGWLQSEKGKSFFSNIFGFGKEAVTATVDMAKLALQGNMQGAGMRFMQAMSNLWDYSKGAIGLEDGIMRPDGTITQVAPDDWVFAARNVGDLAKAFIPQGITAGGNNTNEYVINQTFNISGSKDIPQVLRQQAYNGVQDGLAAVMSQSSQRFQYMSGTR